MPPKSKLNTKRQLKNNSEKPNRITRSASVSSGSQISLEESFKMASKPDDGGGGSEKTDGDTSKSQESQFATIIKKLDHMEENNKKQLEAMKTTFDEKLTDIKTELMKVYSEARSEVDKTREEVKELRDKVEDIEKGTNFIGDTVDDLQKELDTKIEEKVKEMKSEHAAREKTMKEKIKGLEEKMLLTEKHNRKYNLLFYGIPDPPVDKKTNKPIENTEATLKEFFKSDLKLSELSIENIGFGNVHRLNPNPKGPTPIIARFLSYTDRETVFRAARTLRTGKKVLSDLPVVMKEERHRLAGIAYHLRHKPVGEKKQTRITEEGTKVKLQVRATHLDKWEDFDSAKL